MSFEAKVVGIPLSVDDDALHDFFSRFGSLADLRREGAEEVFIAFDTADDLEDALQVSEFEDGTKITVTRVEAAPEAEVAEATATPASDAAAVAVEAEAVAPADAAAPAEPVTLAAVEARVGRDARKLRVSDLPTEDVTEALRELFAKCGAITDFFYRPRGGYAFVGYDTNEAVMEALKLNGTPVSGQAVRVELKRTAADRKEPREPREPREARPARPARDLARRVVVKHVGDAPESSIRELFASCGDITDLFVNRRSDVCFLEFATKEASDAAIGKSGASLGDRSITVEARAVQRCFHCDQEGHLAAKCPKNAMTCHECGRPGHKARDCPDARGGRSRGRRDDRRRSRRSRSRSRSDSRDRYRRHRSSRRDDSAESRDRRRRRRSPSRSPSRSRSRSPARKLRRRDRSRSRSRTPPRAQK